jgi:hypothetical protein
MEVLFSQSIQKLHFLSNTARSSISWKAQASRRPSLLSRFVRQIRSKGEEDAKNSTLNAVESEEDEAAYSEAVEEA